MQLTDRMIADELSAAYKIRAEKHVDRGTIFSGILLKTSAVKAQPGWVYVMETETAAELIEGALYIIPQGGTLKEQELSAAYSSCSYIVLEEPSDPGEVLNYLIMAQRTLEHWDSTLYELRTRGSLQDMLNISLEIFHNPLVILNTDMSIHARAGTDPREMQETGTDMDVITAIIRDDAYLPNLEEDQCYWGPEYITGIRSLGCNIRIHSETRYVLALVQQENAIRKEDTDLLEILAQHVTFMLREREQQEEDASLHKILIRILSDRMLDYIEASNRLESLGWRKSDDYQCLIYQLTYVDRRTIPTSSIIRFMEEQYTCCSSFVFHGDIVTFFDLSKSELSQEEILKQLKPFIRDSYLKAAFSRTVKGHMNLRRQYVQASIAMDVGSRRDPYRWIHYFDRIALDHILEQITRRLPMDMVAHEGILRLKAYDAEHGTDYVKTLRVYLDNHQNAVQSARDLFIHRSTFLYRIEKIRELTQADLDNPDEALYCSISLRLMERQGSGVQE